jgi:threonine dehydrogenase-like Zn-dependent dehydrogenase
MRGATALHGPVTAKVGVGSTVYVAGAGPVGLAAAGLMNNQIAAEIAHITKKLVPSRWPIW